MKTEAEIRERIDGVKKHATRLYDTGLPVYKEIAIRLLDKVEELEWVLGENDE